ncbi:MAG: hypothetical protein AAGK02_04655 [Pseudomonadota bacterium]
MPMTLGDEEIDIDEGVLLGQLKSERIQSVGFEGDDELADQRERALQYLKGEMDDIKALKNRSKVVSTDVADAVETVLPDLLEILTGGEDVGTFKPQGPEDEESAKLETDYVNEVVFDQNPGFHLFATAIRDACEVKTGVFKHWWEDETFEEERVEGKTEAELGVVVEDGSAEIAEMEPTNRTDESGMPLFNATLRTVEAQGRARIDVVDPANFGVSPDTVLLKDTPYCVERSYPRAFQLVEDGIDKEMVDKLPESHPYRNEEQEQARDTVDEFEDAQQVNDNDRRTVEVHTHTIRADYDGDGKTELWCIITDADESFILDAYRKNRVGYAAGSPYLRAHRFYGFSVADKLIEIQRIKTTLFRMLLDNGYFTLNQRYEVAESKASDNTINDLLRNEPGFPVRSQTGDAVRPISNATLGFDVTGALEYVSTVAEQRSGIVRNAQGLNPDTLHDTKGGMEKLFSAAQRRTRMIARVLAETMIKDLFVGVHGDIRDHASRSQMARFNGKWTEIDPTSWGNRDDMTIEVGVGSGGKEMEVAAIMQVVELQSQALEGQMSGAISLPMVTEKNLYASATRLVERLGLKAPELYFTDPEEAQQLAAQQPDEPDREAMAAQAEMQLEQQKAQQQGEIAKMKAEADAQIAMQKAQAGMEVERMKAGEQAQLARDKAALEMELAEMKANAEFALAQRKADMEEKLAAHKAMSEPDLPDNRPGGDLSK